MIALALTLWPLVGFFAFMALHQWRTWPSRPWIGYACAAVCGPGVWLLLLVWWLRDTRVR
ncbi:MAG TPA: hypothetical protein VEB23_13435 [Ramlibacter sp.]|nr:hypothetical protein [Ramlibacter sp.]